MYENDQTVERFYVFPNKSWGWDDGLPPPRFMLVRKMGRKLSSLCLIAFAAEFSDLAGLTFQHV